MKAFKSSQSGFSLIEIMVVLVIMGLMASLVAPQFIGQGEAAKVQKAQLDISVLEQEIERYKLITSVLPTTEQGLEALVNKPDSDPVPRNYPEIGFIKSLPQDPWGNDYELISPGEIGIIDIFSYGPDGEPGTDDDIGNWKDEEEEQF